MLDARDGVMRVPGPPSVASLTSVRTTIQFVSEPPFDPGKLILLVQRDGRIRFAGSDRVRLERGAPTLALDPEHNFLGVAPASPPLHDE